MGLRCRLGFHKWGDIYIFGITFRKRNCMRCGQFRLSREDKNRAYGVSGG